MRLVKISLFLFLYFMNLTSGRLRRSQLCHEEPLDIRENSAEVVFTGTIETIYRGRLDKTYGGIVKVKRLLKGSSMFVNDQVIVQGFGDRNVCVTDVQVKDTRIFLCNWMPNGNLRLNSSLLRINVHNLDMIEAAVKDLPYRRRPNIPEKPCEKMYCTNGAQCLVDEQTQQAYCRCQDTCSDVFAPVCGSDGVTYSSECQMKITSCSQQRRIYAHHQGSCDVRDPCERKECHFGAQCKPSLDGRTADCICPEKCSTYGDGRGSRPVCGTDGRDYPNICEMKRTSCREMRGLEVRFMGRCDPCEGVECPNSQVCQLDDNRNPICRCNANCSPGLRPVCGSDGKTYTSECSLRVESCKSRKNIRIVYQGECSSGENPCERLQCGLGQECDIDKFGHAECQCPPACESVMRPVCGTDGKSYHNECELHRGACLQKRIVSVAYSGECGDTGPCHNYRCSYGAMCVLKNNLPRCECPTCAEEFEPVCGSDGMSYSNRCKMRREACENRKDITVTYNGLCNTCDKTQCEYYAVCELDSKGEATCVCPQTCVQIEAKVCGNDGVTYKNECELRVSACTKKLYIMVASKGPCDLCINVHCKYGARCEDGRCVCPTECPDTYEAICSSDGSTYQNECEMRRAACVQTQDLSVFFYGECEDVGGSGAGAKTPDTGSGTFACEEEPCRFGGICDYDSEGLPQCICSFECPSMREPVCGSDGKFYDNDCKMREESCKVQKKIFVVPKNKCQKRKEIACDGEKPLVNPVTGKDYICGKGPDAKTCPPSSYCHKTTEFSKCCMEVALIKSCADTVHKCCPDGRTSAQGPGQAGCPSVCNCNRLGSYGMTCDPTSKQCPCKPGVGGLRCDRCEPGFWGLHKISEGNSGCSPCACNLYGSVRDDCEQMTGRCVCKHGIQGMKCDICPHGTVLGSDGCMDASIAKAVSGSCDQLRCYHGATCKERESEAQCICDFKCTPEDVRDPVCGSDGNTYASECQLLLFSCRYQKAIDVVNNGSCKRGSSTTTVVLDVTTTAGPSRRSTEDRNTTELESKPIRELTENLPENLMFTERMTHVTLSTPVPSKIFIPLFSGNSYLELKKLPNQNKLTLELEFRSFSEDGILLYNGQKSSGHGDYVSLAINEGFVEFRYNLGNGAVILRSPERLVIGKFHRVIAKRYLKEGVLNVDGSSEVSGKSNGPKNSLDLEENLFLGHVTESKKQILSNIGTSEGFKGCIRLFKIGKRAVDISYPGDDVINAVDIRECVDDSCTSMPCQNGASCAISEDVGYSCKCAPNFSGRHCEIPLNPCASSPCASQSTCEPLLNNSFVCHCSPESTGKTCDITVSEDEDLTVAFEGDGYLQLPTLSRVGHSFTIEIWFLTRSLNGILLFNGQKSTGNGDFLAVTLLNGFLHFAYNLGSGTANITSPEPVILGVWHSVKLTRVRRKGTLQVDSGTIVSGESRASLSELNLEQPLYIGGVPNIEFIRKHLGVHTGWDGAVQRMIVNGDVWEDLISSSTRTHAVRRYRGPPCHRNPCRNGGRCTPQLNSYQCQCSMNYTGDLCDESFSLEINDFAAFHPVSFDGKTFLKFSAHGGRGEKQKRKKENHFEFTFRSGHSNGLLLWTNKGSTIQGDYLALAILDGRAHLSFNLGKQLQPMYIESAERVDDNKWHTVIVKRNKRLGVLSVDGHSPATKTSDPGATELNTDGVLWIGGSPSVPAGLPPAYYSGFRGCIESVFVEGESLHLSIQGTQNSGYCHPS